MNCHESVIGPTYFRSERLVTVGDRILLDGHTGIVKAVFEPLSSQAEAFACFQTGGVLLKMDKFGDMLESFGTSGFLELDSDRDD